jgi:hypothetical protein
VQLDFVELPINPMGVGDRLLARVPAAEKREFNPAVLVRFLDTPIAAVLAVAEDLARRSSAVVPLVSGWFIMLFLGSIPVPRALPCAAGAVVFGARDRRNRSRCGRV